MRATDLQRQIADLGELLARNRKTPCATYRLQLTKDFTFRDARALIPYLDDLGISHLYSSPILTAVPGSTHGYDICDPGHLNPELGTPDDFDALVETLHERGMGLVVDIVPNHMGIASDCNRWWMDVLENGPASDYASYFDIDWHPVKPELENRVLLPILEDQYGNVLENGRLRLAYEAGAFWLTYADRKLPVAPRTYHLLLDGLATSLLADFGEADERVQELQSILTSLGYLPDITEADDDSRALRRRETEVIKRRLAALMSDDEIRSVFDGALEQINGVVGSPRSFDRLDALINAQSYRAAFWRVAAEEINYRRFFDINTMAAIRVEQPDVFHDTHALILDLVADGKIDGLRIDHPDGLWDPTEYFRRLQVAYLVRVARRRFPDADESTLTEAAEAWVRDRPADQTPPLYVIVEKILNETEPLPPSWIVDGTTGYDFVNLVNGLFVDPANEGALNRLYNQFTGDVPPFHRLEYQSKRAIMQESLAGEVNALAHQLERISEKNRHTRDFTLNGLLGAIREIIACMAIYRTYITGADGVSERDVRYIEQAVAEARRLNPQTSQTTFNFLRETLLLRNLNQFDEADRASLIAFVMKFQQVTSPTMAKSVEDTAFYIYNRLVSLNEVGGSPATFGTSVEQFHSDNARRRHNWPHAMLSSSTHDTKRSEDVRARLNVLSELPDEWGAAVERWRRINAEYKTVVDGSPAPDANDEYLLYQSLVGALPEQIETGAEWAEFKQRMTDYMAKATHEAKVYTSWTNANEAYDKAVADFVAALLDGGGANPFVQEMVPFARRIASFGVYNSLSQTLLKLTSPGVPDTYRGTELWDFSLVDPDNRRPVDFDLRQRLLADLRALVDQPGVDKLQKLLVEHPDHGAVKLYVILMALAHRRKHSALFSQGDYVALTATGSHAENVISFSRSRATERLIAIAPRLVADLTGGVERPPVGLDVWGDTRLNLPAGSYRDLFTGRLVTASADGLALAEALNLFPLALLVPST